MAKKIKNKPITDPPKPRRVNFCAARDCALGAGRITRGQVIFTAERIGLKGWDTKTVQPVLGPGIGDDEHQVERVITNAQNNPQLLEMRQ